MALARESVQIRCKTLHQLACGLSGQAVVHVVLLMFDVHSRTLKGGNSSSIRQFWVKLPKTSVTNVGDEKVIVNFKCLVPVERTAVSSCLFRGEFSDDVMAPTGTGLSLQLLISNIQGDVRDFSTGMYFQNGCNR